MFRPVASLLLTLLALPLVVACSDDGGGGGAEGGGGGSASSFPNPPARSNWSFITTTPGAAGQRIEVRHVAVVEKDGKSWSEYLASDATNPSSSASALVSYTPSGVEFGEVKGSTTELVGEASASPPLGFVLTGEVGEEKPIETTISITLGQPGNPGTPNEIPLSGSYRLVAENQVVETPLGQIAGVSQYAGSAMLLGSEAAATVWLAPSRGPVAFEYSWPSMPGDFQSGGAALGGLSSQSDNADGTRTLYGETVLDPLNPVVMVNTYDLANDFDADKTVHAKMFVAVRWADGDRARTQEMPPVYEEFGTAMGYFPSYLSEIDASPLHAGESGQGYVWWVAAVDQAAKNEPGDGTSYYAKATYDPNYGAADGAPVRAAVSLTYKPLR